MVLTEWCYIRVFGFVLAYGGVKCMLQLSNRMLFYPYCVKKHLFYGVFRA